ncbi:pullulanase [Halobacillus rhizosphaerae]|uniref:pullulanase n=1 Tax=Halobacillus rhizosphaerae TaxID=3064889 RepID=UPI00398B9F75
MHKSFKAGLAVFLVMLLAAFLTFQPDSSLAEKSHQSKVKAMEGTNIPEGYIRIHYKRLDGNYEGWGLHLWNENGDAPAINYTVDWGEPILFDKVNKWGVYQDIKVSKITNGLNFIIHKGDVKDTSQDRTFPKSGEREFWLVQGQTQVYLSKPEITNELTYAEISEKNQVVGHMNRTVEDEFAQDIQVLNQQGDQLAIQDLVFQGQQFIVTLKSDLDLDQPYKLKFNGKEKPAKISWQLMDKEFTYKGNDLGATLLKNGEAKIKFWSPPASEVSVILYDKDDQTKVIKKDIPMVKGDNGVWQITLDPSNTGIANLTNYYYQYKIRVYGETHIGLDPYAKSMAAFTNEDNDSVGKAAIVDPSSIGPKLDYAHIDGYEKREDAIIWEAHVRDFTSDPGIDSELNSKFGTFAAFAEKLDYLKKLGVTHIQLLPVMKYYYGNELKNERELEYSAQNNNYNWGYDPHNYFSPTGMYSEQPEDPQARIAELKQLIKEIHKRDMGVILDVVYNHTASLDILGDLVPNYYHFMDNEGNPKTGYGGGKIGTTHSMSRKILSDSIRYLTDEYKVDGYRFDLMGDLDAKSVQMAYNQAKELNPDILMLGEGWRTFVGDGNEEDEVTPADQDWMDETNGAAVFSDEMRNELKSGFGSEGEPRFITGGPRNIQTIFNNIKAQPSNIQADDPGDVVQYIAAHDNLTLHDVIAQSIKKDPATNEEEIQRRIRLGNSLILTSQGTSFLHAGQEYGRTKQWKADGKPEDKATYMVDENGDPFQYPYFINDSYDSSDAVNMFDWSKVTDPGIQRDTMEYTRGLIQLRKSTNAFSLGTKDEVNENVNLIKAPEIKDNDLFIGYRNEATDGTGTYYVFVNGDQNKRTISLQEDLTQGEVLVDRNRAGVKEIKSPKGVDVKENQITIDPLTTVVIKVSSARLAGKNRYETAVEVSKAGWSQSDTVVIARGDEFADALAGAPLAYKQNAPILLTHSNYIDVEVRKEVERLGAKHAIVLGGPNAVSKYAVYQLEGLGLTIERIKGKDRFGTAMNIAARLDGNPDKALVVNGDKFPDALSAAPYAAKKGYPILLTKEKELPNATSLVLHDIKQTIVVGGDGAVSQAVMDQLPDAVRFSGRNRYETSAAVAANLYGKSKTVFVSTGEKFADALTGSVLAAKYNAPSLLVKKESVPANIENAYDNLGVNMLYILGGTGAVSDQVKNQLTIQDR